MINYFPQRLTKSQAPDYLGLDETTFDNYFRNACEFQCLPRASRERYYFDIDELRHWKESYGSRTVLLTREDYAKCLDFALAQHFRKYVLSDFGTGRQREFGQKITNWIKGQLGEVALQKYLKAKFNIEIEIDFNIYDEIVPQDIVGIVENGRARGPHIGVGIKSSKPKSAFLVLGENEITIPERRSDVYVYCRPDIPDDHLLRITKDAVVGIVQNQNHFLRYRDLIPSFSDFKCEIAGWCKYGDLYVVEGIPGQDFDGKRYVLESGKLNRSDLKWNEFISML